MTLRRIPAFLAAAAAAALLLSACNGGDEPQTASQPAVAQQPAAQQQQQEAVAPQPAQQSSQSRQSRQASPAVQAVQQAAQSPPSVQDFANLVNAWLGSITHLRTENSATVDNGAFDSIQYADYQFTPDAVYISTKPLDILGGKATFPGLQILWDADGLWLSNDQIDGWLTLEALGGAAVEPAQAGIVQLSGLQRRLAVFPSTAQVEEGVADGGRPVWVLAYEISGADVVRLTGGAADPYSAMNPLGVALDPFFSSLLAGVEPGGDPGPPLSLETRMVADAATGALLGVEMTARLETGTREMITSLASWNEPLQLPSSEPVVSHGEFFASFFESATSLLEVRGVDAYTLLANGRDAVAAAPVLYLVTEISATVNGDEVDARTEIKRDLQGGRFETSTMVEGSDPFRLLWTREGLWISSDGGSWNEVDPRMVGFGRYDDVDDFLRASTPIADETPLWAAATLSRVRGGPDNGAIDVSSSTSADARLAAPELVDQLVLDAAGPFISLDSIIDAVEALDLRVRVAADERTPIGREIEVRFSAEGTEYAIVAVTQYRDPSGISFSVPN